jgi:acyl carrier protein
MNDDEIRTGVLAALRQVAPEVDPSALDPDLDIRDELDVDSMDFFNFVLGLHERFGVEVPERDYPRLASLNGAVAYLRAALPASQPA